MFPRLRSAVAPLEESSESEQEMDEECGFIWSAH